MSDDFPPRIKLGGVWAHTTKNGQTFLSGDFGAFGQIQIWPNKKREGKKDPDMTVYISEKKKKEDQPTNFMDQFAQPQSMTTDNGEEIPF